MIRRWLLGVMSLAALLAAERTHAESDAAHRQTQVTAAVLAVTANEAVLLNMHYRLARAAAPWCAARPLSGLLLRDVRQYAEADQPLVRTALGLAPEANIYVAAVVEGSPAAAAGVRGNTAVVSILSEPLGWAADQRTRRWLTEAEEQLGVARFFRIGSFAESGERQWTGEPGCAALVQVSQSRDRWPRADAQRINVPPGLWARVGDDGVVASVAHELSHIILRHSDARAREQGLSRSARRDAAHAREFAADRLAIWILHRAGHDAQLMVNLLRREGEQSGNAERSFPRHPSWAERVRRADAALVEMRERLAADPGARP
jgi:hypothetical protein